MTTFETGKTLVSLCKQKKNLEAINSLYSPDIVSVEPMAHAGTEPETHGLDAVRSKNVRWNETQQVHAADIEGPFVNGDRFAVNFHYDVTDKKDGKRKKLSETGLYTVKNGKIVKEEFFSPESVQ